MEQNPDSPAAQDLKQPSTSRRCPPEGHPPATVNCVVKQVDPVLGEVTIEREKPVHELGGVLLVTWRRQRPPARPPTPARHDESCDRNGLAKRGSQSALGTEALTCQKSTNREAGPAGTCETPRPERQEDAAGGERRLTEHSCCVLPAARPGAFGWWPGENAGPVSGPSPCPIQRSGCAI